MVGEGVALARADGVALARSDAWAVGDAVLVGCSGARVGCADEVGDGV